MPKLRSFPWRWKPHRNHVVEGKKAPLVRTDAHPYMIIYVSTTIRIAQRRCPSRLPSHALATQTHRHGTWCRELDQARQVALFGFNFLLSMLKRIHNTKMEVWKMICLFNWVIVRFHVKFSECRLKFNRSQFVDKTRALAFCFSNTTFWRLQWWKTTTLCEHKISWLVEMVWPCRLSSCLRDYVAMRKVLKRFCFLQILHFQCHVHVMLNEISLDKHWEAMGISSKSSKCHECGKSMPSGLTQPSTHYE